MSNDCKRKMLKDILPILWSSYEHMYNVRESSIQSRINFMLIMVSFLPVVCITLSQLFENKIFLIPAIFQVFALLILLKSFFIKGLKIPWVELNSPFLKNLDNDNCWIDIFAQLKACENATWTNKNIKNRIINLSLFFLIFSIYLIILSFFFYFFHGGILLYIFSSGLSVLFLSLYFLYYKKIPSFNFDNDYNKFYTTIEEWSRSS